MAIDSANKRSSSINVGLPWRAQNPIPDGSFTAADRAHYSWSYAGLSYSDPVTLYGWLEYTATGHLHFQASGQHQYTATGRIHVTGDPED